MFKEAVEVIEAANEGLIEVETSSQLFRRQKTLKKEFSFSGLTLFLGKQVQFKILPGPVGSGIRFRRVDLPSKPFIPASLSNVETPFRFTLLRKGDASVSCVEHLLSILYAAQIDNALIEIDGPEVPIGDGSCSLFIEALIAAGTQEQDGDVEIHKIKKPLYIASNQTQLVALPADEFKISCLIHYPAVKQIGSQFYSFSGDFHAYCSEVAPCRTFSEYEEVAALIEKGLIKGGTPDTALVFKGGEVLNKEGARFKDEPVRHKVLDLIGDLSLIGMPFTGHIIAIRPGHATNALLAKEIYSHLVEKSQ